MQGGWGCVSPVGESGASGSCPIIKQPYELGHIFSLVPVLFFSRHCQSLCEKLLG